jgi:gamma-glutamylcyclotransferase (GGCT)/AIG2-like uncharacterized protein YtfP
VPVDDPAARHALRALHGGARLNADGRFFAYGTLVLPEVMEAVTGRAFAGRPALLRGFARRRLLGRSFPGLVEERDAATAGVLYDGVDAATLATLDRFEGPLYERAAVAVELDRGTRAACWVYRLAPAAQSLVRAETWELAGFGADERAAFLAECRAFRAGLGPGPAVPTGSR